MYNPDTYQAVEIVYEDMEPVDFDGNPLGINIELTSVKVYINVIHRDNNVSRVLFREHYFRAKRYEYILEASDTKKELSKYYNHILYVNKDKIYTYLNPLLLEDIDISHTGYEEEDIFEDAIRLDWFTYTKEGMQVLYSKLPKEWQDKALGYSADANCKELFKAKGL